MKGSNLIKLVVLISCLILILPGVLACAPKPNQTGNSVGIPNPIKEVKTIEEANSVTGFKTSIPTALPFKAETQEYSVIAEKTTQVIFKDSKNNELTYRMGSSKEDISGVYDTFKVTDKSALDDGIELTLKGEEKDKYTVITWADDKYSYSIVSSVPMTLEQTVSLIKSR